MTDKTPAPLNMRDAAENVVRQALLQAEQEGFEWGVKEAIQVVGRWQSFYQKMQDNSAPGENDGMYRAFAAEDIAKELLSLLSPREKSRIEREA